MGETFYFPSHTQFRFFAFIILLQKNQYFFKLKSLKLIKMIKIVFILVRVISSRFNREILAASELC